jgi:hypothetical protein
MARTPRRGARSAAAPLVISLTAVLGLAGCSGSHHAVNTASTPVASSPAAPATTDAQAARLLAKAASTLAAASSYRFVAVETVAAKTPVTTHVTGAVVRNSGVSYALTTGSTTTQVVRIKGATYVRKLPGRWAKLQRARPVADPTATLNAILRGLAGVSTVNATTVAGTLPPSAATSAGIPTTTQPAQVTVTTDAQGHVTRVAVHTSTQAGSTPVAVTLVTSYTAFDRVPALHRPV